ncbi:MULTISPECIES: hypothetical protein [Metallosphaera]|uniref:Thioredoxin n=3 Tax=Metallosphaera TaxID=41980 RepID=A4YHZ8_METS5|nr:MULTISPECIES: hypothetical protein [Metallosphaera]BCS91601.1 MAG: hypothetical protein MjAS7_0209 [Metallosphaera javensis (ex Sakai et al. 2022)]ABP96050.1 hypothetical protein Msed_1910 [Metallosphaera sedula DSM 5348]AIM28034.1 hypothetical protein HA72_1910 [Metallosphaera sedula]AKV74867.1 hypothetical protein MsedA_1959 [Metallosphaera sedula]AKV77104.1 hypothetical protein MsedB_1961 [Metallosphaera sedula]
MKAKKLILVTSESHPNHKGFLSIAESIAKEFNLELETKLEDYAFLSDYGEKDEFGMSWLPQLLVQLEDGRIYPILTQMPIGKDIKPDPEAGRQEAINKIKNLVS